MRAIRAQHELRGGGVADVEDAGLHRARPDAAARHAGVIGERTRRRIALEDVDDAARIDVRDLADRVHVATVGADADGAHVEQLIGDDGAGSERRVRGTAGGAGDRRQRTRGRVAGKPDERCGGAAGDVHAPAVGADRQRLRLVKRAGEHGARAERRIREAPGGPALDRQRAGRRVAVEDDECVARGAECIGVAAVGTHLHIHDAVEQAGLHGAGLAGDRCVGLARRERQITVQGVRAGRSGGGRQGNGEEGQEGEQAAHRRSRSRSTHATGQNGPGPLLSNSRRAAVTLRGRRWAAGAHQGARKSLSGGVSAHAGRAGCAASRTQARNHPWTK